MNDTIWAELRKPFPPDQIGKLPRGGTQLDYVGHADVTSRLLAVDPTWNWEPLSTDENGLPRFDLDDKGRPVGLWIKLTIGGVTRLGYGSCPSGQSDAVKVLIGDALRNSALRFGVALDLWAKGDRANPAAENPSGSGGDVRRGRGSFEDAAPARPSGQGQRGQTNRPATGFGDAAAVQAQTGHAQRMTSVPDDDPWYGGQPEPAARPQVTRPEAAETDPAWLDLIGKEIDRIKSKADGTTVWAKIVAAFNDHTCTPADRKALEGMVGAKVAAAMNQEKGQAA